MKSLYNNAISIFRQERFEGKNLSQIDASILKDTHVRRTIELEVFIEILPHTHHFTPFHEQLLEDEWFQ